MRLLFLDIETTGFSSQYDCIIEIAGIIYNTETKEEESMFHSYIKPRKRIPIHISQITGITDQTVINSRGEKEVLQDFFEFIREENPDKYVGHNLDAFDMRWLKDKANTYELNILEKETIDTLKVARKKKVPTSMKTARGNPSYSQESIAGAYGIVYDAHSAKADVEALIKIFNKMDAAKETENKKTIIDRKRIKLGF